MVKDALSDFPLGGFGDFNYFVARDDGDGVTVGVETDTFARDVVDHDRVEILGNQLLAGVFEDILGFRGKPYDDLILFPLREFFQDVGSRFEFEGHRAFALDFLANRNFGTIVGHSSRLDDDGGLRKKIENRITHLLSRLNSRYFSCAWSSQVRRTAD